MDNSHGSRVEKAACTCIRQVNDEAESGQEQSRSLTVVK